MLVDVFETASKILLAEPIHKVLQGEGEHLGKKMLLLRVMGCPVQCPSCDSYHTWDPDRLSNSQERWKVVDLCEFLLQEFQKWNVEWLMITGGEPQIYQKQILQLIQGILKKRNVFFQIETTGMVSWDAFKEFSGNIHFDLSPKVVSLTPGISIENYFFFDSLKDFPNHSVKFVVSAQNLESDLLEIQKFQIKYGVVNEKIYLMPFADSRSALLAEAEKLIEICFERHWNFSPRLHVLLFDSRRLV